MKYDDATWHSGGEYPEDLPPENGATHIGMFLAWAIGRDLAGELLREDSTEDLASLQTRRTTPGEFLCRCCDSQLTNEDLNDVGNQFAQRYYEKEYHADYESVFGGDVETLYHVEDRWENFDRLKPVIDSRFDAWKARAK